MILQCLDVFNQLLEVNDCFKIVRELNKANFSAKNAPSTCGIYSVIDGELIAILASKGCLVFLHNNKPTFIKENTCAKIEFTGPKSRFSLKEGGKTIFFVEFNPIVVKVIHEFDPTPLEEEDFNIFLLSKNIINSRERRKVFLENSFD